LPLPVIELGSLITFPILCTDRRGISASVGNRKPMTLSYIPYYSHYSTWATRLPCCLYCTGG